MATQYTSILKLALPVQGELSGTWGDVVNDNITSMVEEAIAGRKVINTWSSNSHTLTSADGTTAESRAAILTLTDTGSSLTGAGTVICPAASKIYIVENGAGQTITVKTSSGTGIAVPNGKNMVVFCDGTNVEEGITNINSLALNGDGATVSSIKDEDNMASNSATALATQQSIKAYVDSQVGTVDTLAEVLANGNTTGGTDVAVGTGDDITFADSSKAIFGAGSDLEIYHNGSNSYIDDAGTGSLVIRSNAVNIGKYTGETAAVFTADGSVQLRYDNSAKFETTNTGIDVTGEISADGLTVDGADNSIVSRFKATNGIFRILPFETGLGVKVTALNGDESAFETLALQAEDFHFVTGTTERMRIDSSGNVLVGKTSNAISGQSNSIQSSAIVSTSGPLNSHTTSAGVFEFNTNKVAIRAYGATAGTGHMSFNVGGGGGSADSEAMRIDSSGNVGIGTSSPNDKVDISGSTGDGYRLTDGTHTGVYRSISGGTILKTTSNHALLFGTNDTERMRIDSSGNVGIAETDPQGLLHVDGFDYSYFSSNVGSATLDNQQGLAIGWNKSAGGGETVLIANQGAGSAGGMVFATNTSLGSYNEAMRIDSSGNLLVGTTSATGASASGVAIDPSTSGGFIALAHPSGAASGRSYAVFRYNSTIIGNIAQSGTTAVLYNTSSDQRLKDNIVDAPSASDDIDAIQVRSFDWKADGSHQKYGMVAQELQTVAPEAVSEGETEEDMMGVDYSKLVPMMLKEIQSLRARVAQLETN